MSVIDYIEWSSCFNTVRIYIAECSERYEELLSAYKRMMPDNLVECSRFGAERRKCEWLSVRLLLGQVLGKPVSIGYRSSGRPFIPNGELSVSHTDKFVGIALSDYPVGLDIEARGERALNVMDYFLTVEERTLVLDIPLEVRSLWASYMWSAKESVYKLFGDLSLNIKEDIHLTVSRETNGRVVFLAKIRNGRTAVVECGRFLGMVVAVSIVEL